MTRAFVTGPLVLLAGLGAGCYGSAVIVEDEEMMMVVRMDPASVVRTEEDHREFLKSQIPLFEYWTSSALAGERIRMIRLLDQELLVITGRWMMHSLDRTNGLIKWSTQLRHPLAAYGPDAVLVPPAASSQFLYVLYRGDILECLWRSSGEPRWRRRISEFTPGSPLGANDFYCFIGALDTNRIYAIRQDDQKIAWEFPTRDSVIARPVEADPTVYVTDLAGRTYAINSATGRLSWLHDAARTNRADLYVSGGTLYVGSNDKALYALDRFSSRPRWVFETGGPVETPPAQARDTVYVRARDVTDRFGLPGDPALFAIDQATGKERWRIKRGLRLACRGEKLAYVLREGGVLVVVENDSGHIRQPSAEMDGYTIQDRFEHVLTNDKDDVLYLATRDGFLFALKESNPKPYG
ncbi:MAG: PQQ-like beta-propeller repeat protein [Planctomycetales bacterium]|nr:PQQ-like beta-propeller repeat protein [Planctomycetales bacterium]